MSEINKASGGDGWSEWWINRLRSGPYEVVVVSHAERNADGTAKEIHRSENIRDGRRALDEAISKSSEYAYRMFS